MHISLSIYNTSVASDDETTVAIDNNDELLLSDQGFNEGDIIYKGGGGGGLDEVDSEHEYNDDNIDELVTRTSYFQDFKPTFYGLTGDEATKKIRSNQNAR